MNAFNEERVLNVHHWNDSVFSFTTTRNDFPPNLDDLRIQQLAVYFPGADGAGPLHADVRLRLLQGASKPALGEAKGVTIFYDMAKPVRAPQTGPARQP